jgi:hypothetical protein
MLQDKTTILAWRRVCRFECIGRQNCIDFIVTLISEVGIKFVGGINHVKTRDLGRGGSEAG